LMYSADKPIAMKKEKMKKPARLITISVVEVLTGSNLQVSVS
jgi:hypothetical protein